MQTYIALLRGINVSGHNKIKMVDLKLLFIDLGFSDIVTYIQSGNVIFKSLNKDCSQIEHDIVEAIKKHYDYSIKVMILTKKELEIIFKSSPFSGKTNLDNKKIGVTFLKNNPVNDHISKVEELASPDEIVIFNKNTIYMYCSNGFGKTKLTNNTIERKLNTDATSRNWNTVSKLVNLCNL